MKFFFIFSILFSISLNALFIKEKEFNEKIYLRTYGNPNNEAIVFVHGLGNEASTIWDETIESLRDDYYIVTFDLPGFGKSTKSNQLYSIDRYVIFVDNIVNTYIDKPFHLVGHSMGGAISLKYASIYQDKLKTLALIDVAGVLTKTSYTKFLTDSKIKDFFGFQIF